MQQQHRPCWDVGVGGSGAFPQVRPVLGTMGGLDPGPLEKLPNKFATLSSVVLQGLVRPFPGHEDTAPGDAEVFGLVCLAFAPPRGHGVSGAVGLDSVEQPHRTPRRARRDPQLGVQPVGVIMLPVGRGVGETGGLPDAFRQVHRESLTAYSLHDCIETAPGWGAHAPGDRP